MRSVRYLLPILLVAFVLVQAASMLHWFGWNRGAGTGGGRDVTGRWTIVYVDADCREACGTALGRLAGALDRLGSEASRVAPILLAPDAAGLQVDPRIARLAGTPGEIHRVEAGRGDPNAPPGTGLFVIRQPNGAFAATIDGAADAQAIANRLRDLIG